MYDRILVGVDGSQAARRACRHAAAIARCMGSTVVLASVAVADTSHQASWIDTPEQPVPLTEAQAWADAEAEPLRQAGVAVEVKVLEGKAAEALAKEAAIGEYALLAVGERGHHSVVAAPRIGSTAVELARTTPCALLVVP